MLAIIALLSASSCTQQARITLSPSEITIKVGETYQLKPGFDGNVDDSELSKIVKLSPDDGIASIDDHYIVTGKKVGTTEVGVCVYNDPDDRSKGYKYSAFTTVHVVN